MNFDYGNLLTRTFQITCKHKVLWVILMLPMLVSLAALPFTFVYIFALDGNPSETAGTILGIGGILFFIILSIVSTVLYVASSSAVTLGVIRIERGDGSLNFIDLLKDGFEYFWRQLGVFLIIQLSIGAVFAVFFACMFASTMVTMGMASICFQPILILLTPLMFLVMGVLEAAYTAVINEDLGSMDAVKRGLSVIREHVWKYVILTLIIYIGTSIISSILMLPIFFPIFFFAFGMESNPDLSNQFPLIVGIFMCIFFPLMIAFSVISQTLMKTSLTLSFLRLTQRTEDQVISLPENGQGENPHVDGII